METKAFVVIRSMSELQAFIGRGAIITMGSRVEPILVKNGRVISRNRDLNGSSLAICRALSTPYTGGFPIKITPIIQ